MGKYKKHIEASHDAPIWSKRLAKLLNDNNMTQKELSLKTNGQVSASTITAWISGNSIGKITEPKVIGLLNVAKVLNVSVDYLLGNTDVTTNNTEIKEVCDYTGLSEEAIWLLHCLHNNLAVGDFYNSPNMIGIIVDDREKPVKILSKILEHDELLATLYHFLSLEENNKTGIFSNMKANAMMIEIQRMLFDVRESLAPLYKELRTQENYDSAFANRRDCEKT